MLGLVVALAVLVLLGIHLSGRGPLAKEGRWAGGVVIVSTIGTLFTTPPGSTRFRFAAAMMLLTSAVLAFRLLRPRTGQ